MRTAKTGKGFDYKRGLIFGHRWVGEKLGDLSKKVGDLSSALDFIKEKYEAAQIIHSSMPPYIQTSGQYPASPKVIIETFFKLVYDSCYKEAYESKQYDPIKGLIEGHTKAKRKLKEAWRKLTDDEEYLLRKNYDAALLILNSIEPYLKCL